MIGKSRSDTVGSYAILQDGDTTGVIRFAGDDGTDLTPRTAEIYSEVDGTPGVNDMPGRLVFATTADGSQGSTERMGFRKTAQFLLVLLEAIRLYCVCAKK